MSHYVHHVTGRLRVRSPLVKRNAGKASAAQQTLIAFDGVTDVDVSTVTGSITVYYDRDVLSGDHVLQLLTSTGFVSSAVAISGPAPTNAMAERVGEKVGKAALAFVLEKVIERSAVALIAAIV
jgi:hypothetical protein